ncbi:MAG: phosphatidate cytidylyltransferase [Thiolinea sp.]
MLKQRIITAVILALLVASAIYLLSTPIFALVALFAMVGLGAWEWGILTGAAEGLPRMLAPLLPMLVAYLLLILGWPLSPILLLSVLVWGFIIWLLSRYHAGTSFYRDHPVILKSLSLLVLVPAWYALVNLHATHYGYVFYIIVLVACADIGAYFAGKRFGKTKLAPALSPGKTREGVYGGLLLSMLWAVAAALFLGLSAGQFLLFVLFSLLAVVMSVLGDLFESMIKREAGAKDSGTLLPGHGGVLDRIDGLLAALPIFTLGLLWVGGH